MATVLLIDPDVTTRLYTRVVFSDGGHDVIEAPTLAEGRTGLAQRPDLTLVEAYLPDGSVFDLMDELHDGKGRLRSRIIAHTADRGAVRDLANRREHIEFLPKPASPIELLRTTVLAPELRLV